MKAEPIFSVLCVITMVLGLALLALSDADDVAGTVAGIGAVILGILGTEAQEIKSAIIKSQEAK